MTDDPRCCGSGHCIINKVTGELTSVRKYSTNYSLGLYIVPRHVAGFALPDAK